MNRLVSGFVLGIVGLMGAETVAPELHDFAIAQRNYSSVKASLLEQQAQAAQRLQTIGAQLEESAKTATAYCTKQGKDLDIQNATCKEKPKPEPAKPTATK